MKKKIALALLAVALVVGGVAGGVYAVNGHQPVQGQKLVGNGALGTIDHIAFTKVMYSIFSFTNPDCVGEITITQVSVIRDEKELEVGPTVVYEGPYINVWQEKTGTGMVTHRQLAPRPMMPHETWRISLMHYIYTGEGEDPNDLTDAANWLAGHIAQMQAHASYTVEIAWEARKNVCPLIGGRGTYTLETPLIGKNVGETYMFAVSRPMVNLTQRAK